MKTGAAQTPDPPDSGNDGKEVLDALISEKAALDKEIGDLKRSSAVVITSSYVLFTAAGMVASQSAKTNEIVPLVVMSLLPLALTITTIPYMNQTIEVAALAEQRDRLANQVNRLLGRKIGLSREVSGARAGSLGTLASSLVYACLYLASLISGIWAAAYSTSGGWLTAQLVLTVVILAFVGMTTADFLTVREKVNQRLDLAVGEEDRPRDAVDEGSGVVKRVRPLQ